jgi:dihydrofolate reductase
MKPCLSIICAMDENRLIGCDNALPWHMPADFAWFRKNTLGKTVVMGRKTYESIGKPLPDRRNIIITRDSNYQMDGCEICASIDEALAVTENEEEIMLIGGASLYQQTISQADKLYITEIHSIFEGDAWFPAIETSLWNESWRKSHAADEKNPHSFSFVIYEKKR